MSIAFVPPSDSSSLCALQTQLAKVGLNLVGVADVAEFDRAQSLERRVRAHFPHCRAALLVGSGGSDFWARVCGATAGPAGREQLRACCEQVSQQLVEMFARRGLHAEVVFPDAKPKLNLVTLAEHAELGVVSPVSGWLLHPRFGPWLTISFALLFDAPPFVGQAPRTLAAAFQPCAGCDQPCKSACPAGVGGGSVIDMQRCAEHRHAGGCADACEMQRVCPQGAQHRFCAEEEAHRQQSRLWQLQKQFGLGWWQVVPRAVRQWL
jgi:epoxyqueuosine reductase